MIRLILSCLLSALLLVTNIVFAEQKPITYVIYITLDGTRWQNLFDPVYFPKLWSKYGNQLAFYGQPNSNTTMEVASIPVSLPSYQSQMAGSVQPCGGNDCGQIQIETFPEKIFHKLNLNKKQVVTFASWYNVGQAVESAVGTTYTNVGNMPVFDPDTHFPDPVMYEINKQQEDDHPGGFERYDKYTFAQALHYFEKFHPRFMWISLLDADEAGHAANLNLYNQTMLLYDNMLDTLFTTLKNSKLDKSTMVIVTTDHGRGNGPNWTSHGPAFPESKQTWAFVLNGKLVPVSNDGSIYHYSTLSVRPTVEAVFLKK